MGRGGEGCVTLQPTIDQPRQLRSRFWGPFKGDHVFVQVLRPAAAGGGPSGRLAAVGGGMRPLLRNF